MTFADHSSRNVVDVPSIVPTIPNLNLEVSTLEFNTSQSKLSLIRSESDRDPQMIMLKYLLVRGWPKDIKECPLPVRSYWNFRDELSIVNVIIVKGTRIIIPTKYRPELLSLIHDDSHLGIDTCVLRSKGTVYWPGITEHIKSIVNKSLHGRL